MTDLNSFTVTDDVTSNLASYHNRILGNILRSEFYNSETIAGTRALSDSDTPIQVITASGGSQIIKLPLEATTNHPFLIYNTSVANTVVVKDSTAATTFATLAADEMVYMAQVQGEGWKKLSATFPAGTIVGTTDTQVLSNKTLTTPTIASFVNANHNHSDAASGGALIRALSIYTHVNATFAPADATTYYWGSPLNVVPTTTAANHKFYIQAAGTITRADITVHNNAGTVGSAESSTIYFRLNNTTDTTLSSAVKMDAASGVSNYYNITGLSIAVTVGDYFEIKLLTATFATNPTNVCIEVVLYQTIT